MSDGKLEQYTITYIDGGIQKTHSFNTTGFSQAETAARACLMEWVTIENENRILYRKIKDSKGSAKNRVFVQKFND